MDNIIVLTQGKVTRVSPEDFDFLMSFGPWQAHSGGTHLFYALRSVYFKKAVGVYSTRSVRMHRLVCERMNGPIAHGLVVDHANHDTLDNRRENLRLTTQSNNTANARKLRRATSVFKGVSWSPQRKKWRALITIAGRRHDLGFFACESEAGAAYAAFALKARGEFACSESLAK